MESDNLIITEKQVKFLEKIFITRIDEFERFELCEYMGITEHNSNTYNSIIKILKHYKITKDSKFPNTRNSVKIKINRILLEKLILSTEPYKIHKQFQKTAMVGCILP